jgi:hypothetical protein
VYPAVANWVHKVSELLLQVIVLLCVARGPL